MKVFTILTIPFISAGAFAPSSHFGVRTATLSLASSPLGNDAPLQDRRDIFTQAAVVVSAVGLSSLFPFDVTAADASGIGTDPAHPIVVIGAGGKCGKLCAEILNQKGLYTKALTRSGREILDSPSKFVSYGSGDVTNYESMKEAIKGASGVIFAASASGKKKGGDPAHVDYLGVYNAARACLECEVPKLVVISAGTVTRPESAGYKATNFFVKYVYGDNIMGYKIAGEAIMRDMYAAAPNKSLAYTVVRPGGLSDKPSKGATVVHISQGDVYSSEVTREDVAQVSVAALLKGKATDFTTFELNQLEGLTKAQGNLPDLPPQLVHAGAPSFDALLDGLVTDEEMKTTYASVVSGFRGDGIESIEKLF